SSSNSRRARKRRTGSPSRIAPRHARGIHVYGAIGLCCDSACLGRVHRAGISNAWKVVWSGFRAATRRERAARCRLRETAAMRRTAVGGPAKTRKAVRVAIIGGGCGSMAAAFELTRPEHHRRYQVTVYQQGFRLGGKGASGRGPGNRIEEHGLHIWMGFYEN